MTWRRAAVGAWAVAVLAAAAAVLLRDPGRTAEVFASAPAWAIASAALLLAAAKPLLSENARIAAARRGLLLGHAESWRLYTYSQLGKYVPGSVWHFVGRAAAYRARGATPRHIADVLLVESVWLLGGAVGVGAALAGPWLLVRHAGEAGVQLGALAALLALAAVGAVVAASSRVRRRVVSVGAVLRPGPAVIVLQLGVWGLLGSSFAVLCAATGTGTPWVYALGLFSLAYAAGFAVVFLPAGLGVRDTLLVVGLLPYSDVESAVLVAALSRLLYAAVELGLAAGTLVVDRLSGRPGSAPTAPRTADRSGS